MQVLMLSAGEVARLLDPDALLDALTDEFQALSAGDVVAPGRGEVSTGEAGFLLAMPVYRSGREITVKMVSVFHGNDALAYPPIRRSSASSMARRARRSASWTAPISPRCAQRRGGALHSCARPRGCAVLAIIGAGAQGQAHLKMMQRVRDFREIRIASQTLPTRNSWPRATNGRAPSRQSRRQCAAPMSSASAPAPPNRCYVPSGSLPARMSPRWATGHLAASWAATSSSGAPLRRDTTRFEGRPSAAAN